MRFDVPGAKEIVEEHAFNLTVAAMSVAAGLIGIGIAAGYYLRNTFPRGTAERSGVVRTGYRVLVNKYYLDNLFVDGIIRTIQYPIAKAAYWINQKVIDGVVNGVGIGARKGAQVVYDVADQKVIDGAVNGAGFTAEEGGIVLRQTQTGRVQTYAAILFGASALIAVGLVLFT